MLNGGEKAGQERMGEPIGAILTEEIPALIVELGKAVAASGLDFDAWLDAHEEDFRGLAAKYIG